VPTHQTSMLLGMRDTAAMSPSTVTEAGLNEAAGDLDYGDSGGGSFATNIGPGYRPAGPPGTSPCGQTLASALAQGAPKITEGDCERVGRDGLG
jgi:hypothetical protein